MSFNYIEEMLDKKEGTVDYQIRSHPKKIAAFASMEFENVSWVVVVNTRYDQVTGFIRQKPARTPVPHRDCCLGLCDQFRIPPS